MGGMYILCPMCKKFGAGVQHNPECERRLEAIDRAMWKRHIDQDGGEYFTRCDGKEYPM